VSRAVADALKTPEVADKIYSLGLTPAYGGSEELAATQAAHLKRWEAPVKASGFKAQQ
jgi:tripartite-type tricarboxylate transporter receptor subunit TctC